MWDYRALPYSLGDILTWNVNLCVAALSAGTQTVDVVVLSDPRAPSNRYQPYVTSDNHERYLLEVFPAFFTNPLLRSIAVHTDRDEFERLLLQKRRDGVATWPPLSGYVAEYGRHLARDYSTHAAINRFHAERRYVPRLRPLKGTEAWAKSFVYSYGPTSFLVCVHMRQRRAEAETLVSGQTHRDAVLEDWVAFYRLVAERYPEVHFLAVGKPVEWPRELFRLTNMTVIKSLGYGLAEELALIRECDLFMGTNSGPAVMAVFGEKPYLIFERPANAPVSAELWGVEKGAPNLPFASTNQRIVWDEMTPERMVEVFEGAYRAASADAGGPAAQG